MFKKLRKLVFALSGSAAALLVVYLLRQRGAKPFHPAGRETVINLDEVPPVEKSPSKAIAEEPVAEPKPKASPRPKTVAKPAPEADDLKRIEGIGPKTAAVLKDAGITTYKALAGHTPEEIKDILRAASSRGAPDSWPAQAKLAAAKDWDGLAKLQAELKGGL